MIEFKLDAAEDIAPWGEAGNLSLSWFGLSLGEYYLQAGSSQILRYSDDAVDHMRRVAPGARATCFVDYQVARLHEDLLTIVPRILQPVPDDVSAILDQHPARQVDDGLREFAARVEAVDPAAAEGSELLFRDRCLDLGYLTPAPFLCFWRRDDVVVIEWDGANQRLDNVPAWAFAEGRHEVLAAEFIDAVRSFHSRFLAEMEARVQKFEAGFCLPGVHVDVPQLRKEQDRRRSLFARSVETNLAELDWSAVRRSLAAAGLGQRSSAS